MHLRRIAAFLLGAWILGSLFMFVVATQNFKAVDRMLNAPTREAQERIEVLGDAEARQFLRYHSSELNRQYFELWERTQLIIGFLLVIVYLRSSQRLYILALPFIMLLMVAAMHFLISPEIVRLGRMIDFVANGRETATGQQFWMYHNIYSGMEVTKFLFAVFLAWTVNFRRFRKRRTQKAPVDGDVVHNT
jgi:hypothetical protein